MPKGSPELTAARKEEIINACEKLYQTMSFKEITLKEIGKVTSFTGTSIYNYFQTKEEIFLALFQREYEKWIKDLDTILNKADFMDRKTIAEEISCSLEKRAQLLKLLSMNHFDMEDNSRDELLITFKVAYGNSMKWVRKILEKYCMDMDSAEIDRIIYIFFPFVYGIYPYAVVTDKQKVAMDKAGVNYKYQTIYELTYSCLAKLLDVK